MQSISALLSRLMHRLPPDPRHPEWVDLPRLVADFDPALRQSLQKDAAETIFAQTSAEWRMSEAGRKATEEVTHVRFLDSRHVLVPWVNDVQPLAGHSVIEIGCGSGSGSVAFAERASHITGIDIDPTGLEMARRRAQRLNLSNVEFLYSDADSIANAIDETWKKRNPSVALFYAVLEHMTVPERIAALADVWSRLPAGGLLVVFDTPNRLTWLDCHTSMLPFFHSLPDTLAADYASRSNRSDFRNDMRDPNGRTLRLARWGTGVSYHEFELAFNCSAADLSRWIVNDGWNRRIIDRKQIELEEKLLARFWRARSLPAPLGFARQSLDLVFQKPGGPAPSRACPAPDADVEFQLASL